MDRKKFFLLSFAAVVVLVCVLLKVFMYFGYNRASVKICKTPGLDSEFVPQGSGKLTAENTYLFCGYMDNGEPSRIFLVKDGNVKTVKLQNENGSDYDGHAGGITCAGEFVYISNAAQIFVINKSELLSAEDGGSVKFSGSVEVPCRSSFCSCDGNMLYVGEYHAKGYETDGSHMLGTPDGKQYYALVFAYKINPAGAFGLESASPVAAYSICDKIQGFAATPDGRAVLSQSAGFMNSFLKIYDIKGEADGEFNNNGKSIPLYYLDSGRFIKDLKMPRMSEDIECVDGGILVSFEAGASKFYGGIIPFAEKHSVIVDIG